MISRGVYQANSSQTVPPPSGNADQTPLEDFCPHCCGDLRIIPGTVITFRARCTECGDIWEQGDNLKWRRVRMPLRHKIGLASLPVLLWIAGHAEVMS